MMINIYLDDYRHPYDAYTYTKNTDYLQLKWTIVRSYDEFVKTIEEIGLDNINIISADHDLADQHYSSGHVIDYSSYTEKTGYDCIKWLCDYSLDVKQNLPKILVHSMNPVGSENIRKYIENFIKHNNIN